MGPDMARLILRLAVGGLMLPHGLAKLSRGVHGIAGMLTARGLPGFIAYGVLLGEVAGPLLVLIGLWTRPAATVMAFNMAVAVWLAHTGDLFHASKGGGWALELQGLYFAGAAALALLGAGRYAVRNGTGRWD
jgi:putative oxidoreductase